MGYMTTLFSDKQALKELEQSQYKLSRELLRLEQTLSKFGLPKRFNSLPTSKGRTPQNKEEEVISMFKEYSTLPQKIKKELPFMSYMDLHPSLCHKTEFARKKYHTIAHELFTHEMDRESTHKDDTTLHQNDLVSSNSYEVCRNLYDEFDRHADLIQEDTSTALGNDLSTSSLQEVTQEVSNIEATSDFHDSDDETLHEHETAVFSHVQNDPIELSHESTQKLGTNDALYVEDSCHGESDFPDQTFENKLEDSYVDTESQDRALDGHAVTLRVEVCEDTVIPATSTLSVEPSFEVQSSSTLDVEVCMDESTHDAAYHVVSDDESASYHSAYCEPENLYGGHKLQNPHHLVGQLKVNDNMIATTIEHFDVARQMLATYGWSTPLTDEHGDSGFSLAEIHALREAIGMMKQNYLKLLADRDFLLEWDCICYDALKGKEEQVDELTHELEVTMDSLQSAELALQESQLQIEKLTEELSLAQSPPTADIVQLYTEAVDEDFISTGCSEDVVTSITDIGTKVSAGMSTLVESSREPLVASSSPEVSTVTVDAGQFTGSSCVTMVDSLESCVVVHNATPSSQGICRVSSSWEYGSHVDLFPSPGSKSVTSSHAADFGCQLVVFQNQRDQLLDSSVVSDEPLTEVGAFYRDYTVRSAHHFSFDPHTEDLMMHPCGLAPRCHPLWDGYSSSSEDGISSCERPTQQFMGDYLQGQLSVIHHADMYPTGFATSMSQSFLMGTWLQDDYGVSGHDGLVSYHIHGSLPRAVERYCVIDASRYFYLYMANGCGVQLFWDPGGDRFGTVYWMGPIGLLHHFWHGEVEIRVAQRKSEGIRLGRLPFRVWDPGILCATMFMLVLQESVKDVWDISQFSFWASRGLEFLCSGDCLGTSNFREGGL